MWNAIKQLKIDQWDSSSIFQPSLLFKDNFLNSIPHSLPHILITPHVRNISLFLKTYNYFKKQSSCKYPHLGITFNLFHSKEESIQLIDRWIVQDFITDILVFFESNHKECVTQLLAIPASFKTEKLIAEVNHKIK